MTCCRGWGAARGLLELEPNDDKRLKYAGFVDIYAALDEDEQAVYERDYPQEAGLIRGFAERFTEQGRQLGREQGREEGREEGRQEGEALVLLQLLELKFGADAETLLRWSELILAAETAEQVFEG